MVVYFTLPICLSPFVVLLLSVASTSYAFSDLQIWELYKQLMSQKTDYQNGDIANIADPRDGEQFYRCNLV